MSATATGHSFLDAETGTRLDVWYPADGVDPKRTCLAEQLGLLRSEVVTTTIDDLNQPPADSAEALYHQAVVRSNEGQWDRAIELFDRAFAKDPSSDILYGRASSWALKGNADRAIADLRDAIAMNPLVRFHAVNDPDFENIREEPSFIDIIEPTSSGA